MIAAVTSPHSRTHRHEEPLGDFANLLRGLRPAENGQADVEQNNVRLQLPVLLDCFQSVREFANDLPGCVLLQEGTVTTSPWLEIVHDENGHRH